MAILACNSFITTALITKVSESESVVDSVYRALILVHSSFNYKFKHQCLKPVMKK